jgi:chromosome segregation ATPase
MADLESQAKLFSADSIPYQYEVQRLKTDLDEMSAHAKWLDAELVSRNDQIVTLTKDFSSKVYGLRTELDEMTMQKETYCNDFKDLQRRYKASESKVEKLASENLRLKQEASDANSEAEQNLNAERRVVQLQKEQLELLQKRHDDVIRQMESMQAMALEAGKETQEELEIARSELEEAAKRILDEQANNHRAQIKELEAKLQEANRLRHEAEDCLIVSPAKASRRTLAAITAGGEETHGDEEEELPLNLTDAYTLLRKTEQELREERKNHKLAQLRLRRIEEDVKAKMPHYIRQRQEYETAVARDHESRQRLKQALADVASYRTEAQEARRDVFRLQKQNRELEKETTELAKQVQALLASRAGGDAAKGIPTSVEEIQQQNQQLLRENNRLTDEIQVLKSDPLRSNLEAAEKEIEAMKEERQRSELYVASIVQQRDLLRAQLHLDSKVLESELEQASTLAFAAQHLERIKELEAKNKQLEDDVGMSQAEAIRLRGEKDAAADRLLQYEAQVTTLSETVDSYLAQVASAKAEIARTEAEATYHREKCQRLEESLKRSAAEVARAAGAKSALENQNAKQQQALTEADAISSRLKQDLSQVGAIGNKILLHLLINLTFWIFWSRWKGNFG